MQIINLGFLYVLLPASAIVYYLIPKPLKNLALLIISLCIYLFGQRWAFPIMVLNVFVDYLCVRLMWKYEHQSAILKWIFLASLLKNIAIIAALGVIYPIFTGYAPPLGVVVISLSAISYVVSLYKGKITAVDCPINFALYCFFFAKLQFGPVEDPTKLMPQIRKPCPSIYTIADGLRIFSVGIAKKVLIADQLALTINEFVKLPIGSITLLSSVMLLTSKSLWVFFILSGFNDISHGIAKIFSINFTNNISNPLQVKGVLDYIYRLNTSFGRLFESSLEVNNSRGLKPIKKVFIAFISALLIGTLLSSSKLVILWAGVMASLTLIEIVAQKQTPLPWLLNKTLTIIVCMIATILLTGVDTKYAWAVFGSLFNYNNIVIYNSETIYIISCGYIVLIVAMLVSTGLLDLIASFIKEKLPKSHGLFFGIFDIILLIMATSFMMLEVL